LRALTETAVLTRRAASNFMNNFFNAIIGDNAIGVNESATHAENRPSCCLLINQKSL
jgi:hypothetical protein